MRGADILVQSLAQAGVTRIFSLSGNQIMPVYDACIDAGIVITHVRQESAAVFMAEAWAQLTGGVGVALVTAAPGFANALGALVSARGSETPVLLLSGDSPVAQDGMGAFQELDQTTIAAGLTKGAFRPKTPAAMGEDAVTAIRLACSCRPGPVHMALAFDVLQATNAAALVPAPADFAPDQAKPSPDAAAIIAQAIATAAKPLILNGPALNRTRAGAAINALEAATGAPVLCLESPRGLGDPSLGDLAGVFEQADLIVSLGKSIDFTLAFGAADKFADGARWIVVDAEPNARDRAQRNLGERATHVIAASPLAMADAVTALVHDAAKHADWRTEVTGRTAARAACPATTGISPVELTAAIQRQIDKAGDTVLVCDGGEIGQWAQAGLEGDERLINGPGGAIGGGLCYAIAATMARPKAKVFAVMGDGTVGFHLSEFETAARAGAAFVAVIGNDQRWNAEHQIQLREYGPQRLIGCELSGARYDISAAGLGCHGEYVEDVADLDAALDRAVASGKPACVNVVINGQTAPSGAGR
jgi:acetolactate synthase-1/2/3 large subunit